MAALGCQSDGFPFAGDGFLFLADGGRGFEGNPDQNIFSIGDASLNTPRFVTVRTFPWSSV